MKIVMQFGSLIYCWNVDTKQMNRFCYAHFEINSNSDMEWELSNLARVHGIKLSYLSQLP